jgi:hypothetical protein
VRYRTKDFEVGFALGRPGFTHLGLLIEDAANAGKNVLATRAPLFHQGPQLHPLGIAPVLAPVVRCALDGTVEVRGNTVTYDFTAGGQHYRLAWTVTARGLTLRAERTAKRAAFAWHSAAWQIGLRNSAAPSHVLGRLLETGETGAVALPALLTLPAFGSWEVGSATATGWARSDCFRSQDLNTLELKVGEVRTAEGLYRLPAGRHRAVFTLRPKRPAPLFRDDAPAVARLAPWPARSMDRADLPAPTWPRSATTAPRCTCAICMDTWSS